jgi:outer membrane protein assembly factor BamB
MVSSSIRFEETPVMRLPFCLVALMSAFVAAAVPSAAQDASTDYPQWRGQQRDGSASGFTAPGTWPELLAARWKVEIGEGYATPLVVGERVFAFSRREGEEVVTALDAGTGKVIWETRYAAPHKIASGARGHGQGPKSTPLYFDGRLYTLGITGVVSSLEASGGKLLWQKPAPAVETLYNNSAMSPIVDRGAIIFHVGGHDAGALTAFDANTGNAKWSWSGDGPAYASPVIATFQGTRQVVAVTQRHIVGVAAETGALLWQRPFANQFSNNSITPVLFDDMILVSGYEQGVAAFTPVLRNGVWETETRWHTKDVSLFMSNPVLVDGTLYGLSQRANGQFFALDARSGNVLWLGPPREATNTSVVKSGDLLFLLNDDAELTVARANRSAFEPLKRYRVAESATWAQPTISGDRIFVKDATSLTLWTIR